jgi:hypothetical protein
MVYLPSNTTGWSELISGNIIKAPFIMYDTALMGWTIAILFLIHQGMMYMKSRNLTLNFIMGIFFMSMYLSAQAISLFPIVQPYSKNVMFLILVIELAGILYYAFWR